MKTNDIVKGLLTLADRHAEDAVTPFDTDWSAVCLEAAHHIEELQRKLEEAEARVNEWVDWYNEYDADLMKKTEVKPEDADISLMNFVRKVKSERKEKVVHSDPSDDIKILYPVTGGDGDE